jgi:cereblon
MPWNLNPPSDEPMAFSFYMASNMALSEHDKLYILKTGGTVERLRYIYDKVVEQERQQTYVLCKLCSTKLSSATDMFTVTGSEGTSGAYVNEYGVIHQTITLRAVSEQHLWYTGGKETKDSWFPGYSWTIAYCRFCHSHLGWKFERVMGEDLLTADQLELFWGLSAASVTMRVIIP